MSSSLPSLVAILGNDDGLVQEEAIRWYGRMTEGTDEFAHETLNGQADNAEAAARSIHEAIAALQTPSFFGGRKVVWLKGCNYLGDGPLAKSEGVLDALETLLQYLAKGLAEDVYFLLTAYEIDKRRSFYKQLGKIVQVCEYNKPDVTREGWQRDVASMVRQAATERDLSFESETLDLFVNRVSESSRQIFSELDKLSLYLGTARRLVTENDIRLLVPLSRTGVIFEIGRAIEKGNVQDALSLLSIQLDKGEQPVSIMRASIIPVIRNLYMASIIIEEYQLPTDNYRMFENTLQTLPPAGKALVPKKKDGGLNPYPFFLASQQVSHFSRAWLRQALTYCFEADKSLVTANLDNTVVLQRLIIQLTDKKARRKK